MFEELQRLLNRHIQHFVNIFPFIADLQGLTVITLAMADLTGHIDIRQEMHLDLDDTVAGAGLTAATLDIEAEAAFFVAPFLGIHGGCKELTDHIEDAGIGSRIGPGRSADG